MTKSRGWLARITADLERQFESRTLESPQYAAEGLRVGIVPFRSYGSKSALFVRGRVLVEQQFVDGKPQSAVRNLLHSYRRFESDEVPGAVIEVNDGVAISRVTSDEEGYFTAEVLNRAAGDGWIALPLRLVEPPLPGASASAEILVPTGGAEFGIISDLDDTVVESNVLRKGAMLRSVLFGSARTRLPFEGVAEAYRALARGHGGAAVNPLFYVSGAPWNLYDVYRDFLDLQQIPRGAILMADFGLSDNVFIHPEHETHKHEKIAHILATYPDMRFVLVGDSGERDPEIYLDVARGFPGRVIVTWIRDVAPSSGQRLETISAAMAAAGSQLVVVRTSRELLADAVARGLAA